jgi:hypothetical protein
VAGAQHVPNLEQLAELLLGTFHNFFVCGQHSCLQLF